MKFTNTLLVAALAGASFGVQAAPLSIEDMTLTGATFCMDGPGSAGTGTACQTTGAGGAVGNATVTGVDGTYDLVDGYHGAGNFSGGANPASIIDMTFFSSAVNVYTAASNLGANTTPAGSIPGGPVPSGTVDFSAGTMTVDLTSWFANYNGTDFNQGSPTVTGSVVDLGGNTGTFDVMWTSVISGGSFDNFVGTWTLQGNVAAIPEASTYGMMLAGLGLVGGMVARRRKFMA